MKATRHMVAGIVSAGLGLAGCGAEVAPPEARAPVAPPSTASSAAAAAPLPTATTPAPTKTIAGLSRIWLRQSRPFLRGLALVGEHVATLAGGTLELRSLRTGKRVAQAEACDTFEGALGRVAGDALLVCRGEVQRFAVPSLELISRVMLPGQAEAVAFAPDVVAVALDDGSVHVIRSDDGNTVGALALGRRRPAMAVAPGGRRLAVAQPEGDVGVFELPGGEGTRVGRPQGEGVEALAFDGTGARLFVGGRGVAVWSLAPAAREAMTVSGRVDLARWNEVGLALATDEGLLFVHPKSGRTESVADDLGGGAWVGVDVDPTGTHLCAGDRDGRVACWSRDERGGDTQVARGVTKRGPRLAAHVARTSGRDVTVELVGNQEGLRPPEQGTVRLLRFVATRAGRAEGAFWTEVGRGVVRAATPTEVTLRLDHEPEPVPGEREPLPRGVAVELLWER